MLCSGMKQLITNCPALGTRPEFRGIMNLKGLDVIATRLWLDQRLPTKFPANVLAGFESDVGGTFFNLTELQVSLILLALIKSTHASLLWIFHLQIDIALCAENAHFVSAGPCVCVSATSVSVPMSVPVSLSLPLPLSLSLCLCVPVQATPHHADGLWHNHHHSKDTAAAQ